MEYNIGDIVVTKKAHPCATRSDKWEIIRIGADIKIKCLGCGNIVMLSRYNFEKSIKRIEKKENQ